MDRKVLMKVYTVKFNGYYPVGAVALITAENKQVALEWVNKRLVNMGLEEVSIESIKQQDTTTRRVDILLDGDY